MKVENWEDLRLFFHVAQEGGLAGAAEKTGLSAPTIGRRMLALERSTGRALFVRARTGYGLAPDGQMLLDRVLAMQAAAQDIANWHEKVLSMPIVRVLLDSALSHFTAERLRHFWTPHDEFRMCFKSSDEDIHLTHRDADIGLCGQRPKTGNVAARRSVAVAYAPYCAQGFDHRRHCNWVSLGTDVANQPWMRWAFEQSDRWITNWVNTPRMMFDLVKAGAGIGVMPCFIGDSDPSFVRAGPVIEKLSHDLWIVLHDDERSREDVRTVADRLSALLAANASLFSGGDGRDPL
ncbi:LysR family transcriptional regulator [Sinorhizobium numidicum]|uniref:LysR family transcriptional regulator n=1 Tax=Sinorhizobium numidicum TaxID=680248 RepID=A0ABY8CWU2_9HYPH|nr:LysR family transcriptional regulator [Sinorhizobium numidicum]WEX75790.1 LysR family transcriptional regulator [Sinorhizobium numidicum]WEX81773.1 LysR family transcriptional regulator [Sinorhizobium numidicum]